MSWDVIERRVAATTTKPASISLHSVMRKGVLISKPMCQVTLRFAVASQLDWKANEPIGVIIGSGEHAGLMRVIRNSPHKVGKCRVLTRGGVSVNLGHIPQFGLEQRAKRSIDAQIIDHDTVEIVLPNWSEAADDAGEDDEPAVAAPVASAPKPPPTVNVNGVTIVFEDENEHVTFRGQSMEVTARQAKFVAVIARNMPEPCGRTEITNRMWGQQPPGKVDAVLDQIATDLINALAPIGLTVTSYRGVGFALKEIKMRAKAA